MPLVDEDQEDVSWLIRCWGLHRVEPYGVMCRDVPWNVSTIRDASL